MVKKIFQTPNKGTCQLKRRTKVRLFDIEVKMEHAMFTYPFYRLK